MTNDLAILGLICITFFCVAVWCATLIINKWGEDD